MPWDAFTLPTRHSGDQLVAVWSARGWSFTPRGRRIYVRCLWELDDHPVGVAPVGPLTKRGTRGEAVYGQTRPGKLTRSTRRWFPGEVRSGHVSLGDPFTVPGDSATRHRTEVLLSQNRSLWGFTDRLYPGQEAAQVAKVRLTARQVGARGLWDVRRIFFLGPVQATETGGDLSQAWSVVLGAPGWSAQLSGGNAGLAPVHLGGRRVGLPPVPLLPGETPHVDGVKYDDRRARVVVRPDPAAGPGGTRYVASYRDVPPMALRAFMNHQQVVEGRETEASLYFVGLEKRERKRPGAPPAQWLLFEGGYGLTLRVLLTDVRLDGTPLRGAKDLPFFHGDRLTRLTVTPRDRRGGGTDRDRLWLDVHGDAIVWSRERRLRDQAEMRIVPGLTVRLDRDARTVTILRVESLQGTFDARDRAGESPAEVGTPRLRFTDRAAAAVLRHHPTGPDVVKVLRRLDTGKWNDSLGAEVCFHYVRPVVDSKDGHGLKRGQFVFMWGETIHRHPNDVQLTLTLDLGSEKHPLRLTARVTRRTFAHREDVLRRILDEGGRTALRGTPYLVELRGPGDGHDFEGRISMSPARSARALRGYLTSRNPSCFAVVTWRGRELRLELRAGVRIALAPEDLAEKAEVEEGAVVRITRAPDGRFLVRPALPSDSAYAVDGRETVVYPKNTLLSQQDPTARQLSQPLFTLSGLPNVEVPATPAGDGESALEPVARLMRHPHPKIGRLSRTPEGEIAVAAPCPGESAARWLSFDEDTLLARLTPVLTEGTGDDGSVTELEPAQTSFADRSARSIARRHTMARRAPQDRRTGHWPDGTPKSCEPMDLGIDDLVEPVVPAVGPTLRHPLDQARRYGYPAGYLTERRRQGPSGKGEGRRSGGPARTTRDGQAPSYTVAGPIRPADGRASGLWLEISPGRLVEIPGELAHSTAGGALYPLEAMCWELFQPGDTVRMSAHHGSLSEPACVVLHEWLPGLRGTFGPVPAVLTVLAADREKGVLVLGGGNASQEYPVSRDTTDRHAVGDVVRLTPDNHLLPGPDRGLPDRGEAVLVGAADDGTLFAHGLPGLAVVPAEEDWAGDAWIRAELAAGPDRAAALLSAAGGCLTMTVEGLDADGRLRVSRAAQPRLPQGDGTSWECPTRISGILRDGRLVVHAGGALLAVRPEELVPGLPADACRAVAEALTAQTGPLWLRRSADGALSTGLRAAWEAERHVLPFAAVAGADNGPEHSGVLCREQETGALRWLPASHAAWAELSRDRLHEALAAPGAPLWALLLDDGRVSVTGAPAVLSHFRNLRIGRPVNLTVLGGEPLMRPHGKWEYLARMESNGVVVSFAGDSLNYPVGERLIGEVESLTNQSDRHLMTVRCVPRGDRGTVPDLPSAVVSSEERNRRSRPYAEVCDDPAAAAATAADAVHAADEAVVRATLRHLSEEEEYQKGSGLPSLEAAEALHRWIDVRMTDGWETEEIHLLPLLGATVLTAALGELDPAMASLAVQLALNVGERAQRVVHVAPMLTDWLGSEKRTDGLWGRLWSLPVAKLLKPSALEQLVTFGRGRLYGAAVEKDPELLKVAVGLLLSVGESVPLDPLLDPTAPLVQLTGLGRALVPPGTDEVAQHRLHPGQVRFLGTVFEAVYRAALPADMPGLVFLPYQILLDGGPEN
ncbi:hypothetical protein [Streptomyces sp. NPDC050263]|uniref:hypothetical protein n=1 Tax=Streptomyces sp. NPDC050263 TaxID=3155037 RepID=UPI003423DB07